MADNNSKDEKDNENAKEKTSPSALEWLDCRRRFAVGCRRPRI